MSPRTGTHRRTTPAVAPAVAELRRVRAELAKRDAEVSALRALVVELAGGEDHAWCQAARERAEVDQFAGGVEYGRKLEAAERDRAWVDVARPIARGGPAHDQLEKLRYGPGGREHFADPRPGDYMGGDTTRPAVAS